MNPQTMWLVTAIVVVAALPGETASMYSHPEKANGSVTKVRAVPRVSDNFKRDLRTLIRSHVQCLFLYGGDDIEYQNFQLAECSLLANLEPAERARLTVEVWPGKAISGYIGRDVSNCEVHTYDEKTKTLTTATSSANEVFATLERTPDKPANPNCDECHGTGEFVGLFEKSRCKTCFPE